MFLEVATPSVAALVGFSVLALFVLMGFAVAYAKRDVTIDVTVFEFH